MLLSKNFRVISDSLLCFGCLLVYPHFLSGYLSINLLDFRYFQDFLSVFGFQGTGFFGFLLSVSFQLPSSGDGEIRTLDPLLARQVLSQLSYTPTDAGLPSFEAIPFLILFFRLSQADGLKWTRTTDLTLIRRAL